MELLSKLLAKMKVIGAADLFLSPGRPPAFRVNGKLLPPEGAELTPERLDRMANLVMMEDQMAIFKTKPDINIGLSLPHIGRFRVNVFRQRRSIAMVIRAITEDVPCFEALGLPATLETIAMQRSGLIFIVGPAGTGKSSTLASMIEYRNSHDYCHIITLEDPIEYLFHHSHGVVNQREIGIDTESYTSGLANALRQSPDVLMVGEVRELGVLEQLLEFSDTGHLCLATLHANNVTQALERIIKMFPEEKREQSRVALSQNLSMILSQRLVPTIDGKLTLAYEMLTTTGRVADLIRRGEFDVLQETMEKDTSGFMHSLDQCLFKLYQAKRISQETAINHANSVSNMRLQMRLAGRNNTVPAGKQNP